jgi:hypothetical protein
MIATHPSVRGRVNEPLVAAIQACYDCAQACTSCADAGLAEDMVQELRQCIRLNLDCADTCAVTATLAARRTGTSEQVIREMLETSITACGLCGEESAGHAQQHEHCRICAEACRQCEQACRAAAGTFH